MATESSHEADVTSRTPTRQDSGFHSASIGPAEFLELYRTRTVSDPRSDQRLDALSRVRMRRVTVKMVTINAIIFHRKPISELQSVKPATPEPGARVGREAPTSGQDVRL